MTSEPEKPENNSGNQPPARNIILDTNVFSLLSNANLRPKFLDLLKEVVGLGYGIVICDIVLLELIQEASLEREIQIMNELGGVASLPITQEVIYASAHIASMYKDVGLELKQFSTGDRIIAGTAVMNNALILTLNGRDFPEPFFKELDRKHIDYTNGSTPACVYLYFKEPQFDVIDKHHTIRTNPLTAKVVKSKTKVKKKIKRKKTATKKQKK